MICRHQSEADLDRLFREGWAKRSKFVKKGLKKIGDMSRLVFLPPVWTRQCHHPYPFTWLRHLARWTSWWPATTPIPRQRFSTGSTLSCSRVSERRTSGARPPSRQPRWRSSDACSATSSPTCWRFLPMRSSRTWRGRRWSPWCLCWRRLAAGFRTRWADSVPEFCFWGEGECLKHEQIAVQTGQAAGAYLFTTPKFSNFSWLSFLKTLCLHEWSWSNISSPISPMSFSPGVNHPAGTDLSGYLQPY